jgi:hypothetical protein
VAILRAALVLALAACTPDIADGAFHCGPEETCPPDQACDGSSTLCVAPSEVHPFACDPSVLHEPDDTPAQAFDLGIVSCATPSAIIAGCLAPGDAINWLTFTGSGDCTATVSIGVAFPYAFEPVDVQMTDGSGSLLGSGSPCDVDGEGGITGTCAQAAVSVGSAFFIGLSGGTQNCDGACAFTSYQLEFIGP